MGSPGMSAPQPTVLMVVVPWWRALRQHHRADRASPVPGEVVLSFRSRASAGGRSRSLEQRVPITWTKCHLGGWRPWFRCSCGRRAAKLYYGAADFFACRHCCGLAYASQQLATRDRLISRARKIRMQLGGGPSLFDPFPTSLAGCTGALTTGCEREHKHQRRTRIAF
jgi:hypothetical protein